MMLALDSAIVWISKTNVKISDVCSQMDLDRIIIAFRKKHKHNKIYDSLYIMEYRSIILNLDISHDNTASKCE